MQQPLGASLGRISRCAKREKKHFKIPIDEVQLWDC